jgi:hypothetical protein
VRQPGLDRTLPPLVFFLLFLLLVGGAAAAVAIANVSGMSKGEVERIWLPFALWLLLACGAIETSDRGVRVLLAIQAAACFVISTTVVTAW